MATTVKHNFCAGPSILPREVFEKAAAAILDWDDGLSILEISHRSKKFGDAIEEARSLAKELMGLDDDFELLFLQGGASTQFCLVAYNLLQNKAGYLDTGTWSTKAIKEAELFGNTEILASSADRNFTSIPKDYEIPTDLDYFHITTNNTIRGTQLHNFDRFDVPIVADMSSDFLSRPINFNKYSLIYAGAQKNLGPAGTTLVAVRKSILGKVDRQIPSMLDYRVHIKKDSMFNTPPVFAVFGCLLTMKWIKQNGGLPAMEKRNSEKASSLYTEIDRNPLFEGLVTEKEDRSWMNVTFALKDKSREQEFLDLATAHGCVALKGHRSVGGFRASLYNALSIESVKALVEVMQEFERKS